MLIINRIAGISFLTLLLLLNSILVYGQWNFSLTTSQEYNNNPFLSPKPTPTSLSLINIGIEKEINSFGIGYYGSQNFYNKISERNFYWHQIGLWNIWENIKWGAYYEGRFNSDLYRLFNYSEYTTYLNFIIEMDDIYWFLNGSLVYTDYTDLKDLNNFAGKLGVSLNKGFETKTTLLGGININYKYYVNSEYVKHVVRQNRGRFRNEVYSAATSQFVIWGRVAQSITGSTGLAAQYTYRSLLQTVSSEIWQNTNSIGDEAYYFDDPFSHKGYTANLKITQIIPGDIFLEGSFYYNQKNYPTMAMYSDSETISYTESRLDKQKIYELGLSKTIPLNILGESELLLALSYKLINNHSNSYWYNYDSQFGALKLQLQF